MAKAYECDRCGTLYSETDKNNTSGLNNLYIMKPNRTRPLDLCYVCQSKFDEWWNAGKEGAEEKNEESEY